MLYDLVQLFLLCMLLFFYSFKTFKTFLKIYREENSGELHSMSSQFNTISQRSVNNDINQQEERPVESEIYKEVISKFCHCIITFNKTIRN